MSSCRATNANRDGEFWMRTEEVEPLTPAAASLLDALRGE